MPIIRYLKKEPGFYRNLIALALPIILQNVINQLLTMIDTFMVGSLGEAAIAGVTLANTSFFVIVLFCFGIQSGASVLISQYWGKGDTRAINRVLGLGLMFSAAVTAVCAVLMSIFPEQIIGAITDNAELIPIAAEYARIIGFSIAINSVSVMYASALRAMENPRFGMYVLSMSVLLNTFLNWIFIFGKLGVPAMGVKGAEIATLIARVVELIITTVCALRNTDFPLRVKEIIRPGVVIFRDFIRYSAPVVVNETVWGIGYSMYTVIYGHMQNSKEILAANVMSGSIERVMIFIVFGLGGAAAIVVGREIGRGNTDTVFEHAATIEILSFILGAVLGGILIVSALTFLPGVVSGAMELSDMSVDFFTVSLIMLAAAMPVKAVNYCTIVGVLRGGGDVKAALAIDSATMYAFAVPLAALFGLVFKTHVYVVFAILNVEEVIKLIPALRRFTSRKWIRVVTRDEI